MSAPAAGEDTLLQGPRLASHTRPVHWQPNTASGHKGTQPRGDKAHQTQESHALATGTHGPSPTQPQATGAGPSAHHKITGRGHCRGCCCLCLRPSSPCGAGPSGCTPARGAALGRAALPPGWRLLLLECPLLLELLLPGTCRPLRGRLGRPAECSSGRWAAAGGPGSPAKGCVRALAWVGRWGPRRASGGLGVAAGQAERLQPADRQTNQASCAKEFHRTVGQPPGCCGRLASRFCQRPWGHDSYPAKQQSVPQALNSRFRSRTNSIASLSD